MNDILSERQEKTQARGVIIPNKSIILGRGITITEVIITHTRENSQVIKLFQKIKTPLHITLVGAVYKEDTEIPFTIKLLEGVFERVGDASRHYYVSYQDIEKYL
jgi:hypothetical protein